MGIEGSLAFFLLSGIGLAWLSAKWFCSYIKKYVIGFLRFLSPGKLHTCDVTMLAVWNQGQIATVPVQRMPYLWQKKRGQKGFTADIIWTLILTSNRNTLNLTWQCLASFTNYLRQAENAFCRLSKLWTRSEERKIKNIVSSFCMIYP